MKQIFTKNFSVLKLSMLTGLVACAMLVASVSYGQYTYYSRFANTAGHYSKTDPTGCDAPAIQNIEGLADNDDNSYASFEADSILEPYSCSSKYLFDVDLNMAGIRNAVPAGSKAGFRISISTGISAGDLGKYLTVSTYLRDSLDPNNVIFQEYATNGASSGNTFLGIDIDHTGKNWLVYFVSTKQFNLLELAVDPRIIQVDTAFQFSAYFAFGGATEQVLDSVLPAQIANFKASVSNGKNVNLSWQSLTETNVSNYRIERSSNGGLSYSTIASVPAKGNSNLAISYAYSDVVSLNGNYLYRIVVADKNGTSKATNSIAAAISGQGKLILYPTIVKAGQNVTIKTSDNGLVTVLLYDVQGRLVKQQRTTSTGQFTISTSGLSSGVYNVKVISANGAMLQSKIVVN